ncbi:MAG: winged helix-turn-helix domain-containing protein [Candidatus Aenigmatarchaeota archaeon]
MLNVFRRKNHRKNDIEHVLILKKNIQREARRPPSEIYDFEHIKERLDEISEKLSHLHERIDALEGKKPSTAKESADGVKKSRIKKVIENMLKEHGKLTSYDLVQMLGLSRTRCNEYLKEMERAGLVKGTTIKRKRYYEIRQ